MKRSQRPSPVEILIALVIICMVTPAGVSASSDRKTSNDSAVSIVKDGLRQLAEAATLWEKAGGCSKRGCLQDIDKLVEAGKLAHAPQVPSGIGVGDTTPYYGVTEDRMGSCGPKNSGAPRTINANLRGVSEQFCRDYNNSVGLGSSIVQNCASGGDCTASGSTNPYDFPEVKSSNFCFLRKDTYVVVLMTSITGDACR